MAGALLAWHVLAQRQMHSACMQGKHLNRFPVCAQESMRMLPVAGGTVREVRRDVLLGGKHIIPKNTSIFLPLYAIHNSWRNWEQPGRFLPERWLVPGAEYAVPGLTPDSTIDGALMR